MNEINQTIIETIAQVNKSLASDANALTLTNAGEVNPDRAYIELIQGLVSMAKVG